MKLHRYLEKHRKTVRGFAREVGVSPATISRLNRGLNRPDWPTIDVIERATRGAVRANDFASPPDAGGAA